MSPATGLPNPPRTGRRNLIDQLTADAIASDYAWPSPEGVTAPPSGTRARRQRLLVRNLQIPNSDCF